MKYILISLLLLSCGGSGLSSSDKSFIEEMIKMHNTIAKTNYKMYMAQAEGDARIKYLHNPLEDSLVKLTVSSASLGYNIPYEFRKDTAVTIESYLAYCKAMGYDPKEYSSRIDKK